MEWRQVSEAQRMLATERGAIVKDWGGQVPIALVYPNTYAIGMSSLAVHSLYRWLNALPGVVCERAFARLGRSHPRASRQGSAQEPILTLESQRPLRDAAAVAFSLSFEMDYFNTVDVLRRSRIPLRADARELGDPWVILGGPAVSANPMPMAPLADAIVIGEAEHLLADLTQVVRESGTRSRIETLEAFRRLPGVFVPLLNAESPVERQYVEDLEAWPTTTSVIAPEAEFGHMYLIEISRGCQRGCRFCLAGYWYRPHRERSVDAILRQAQAGLAYADQIGLVASAVSDYSRIDELVLALRRMGAKMSVSSLRIRPLSPILVQALADSGSRSITLAPEAGSERLRRAIRKGITHEDIIAATRMAQDYGFESLKLYFMIGLPHETEEDIVELVSLAREIQGLFGRQVVINVTPFVPKAHTPFARVGMMPRDQIADHLERLRSGVRALRAHGPIELRHESLDAARVQGALALGDRSVGEALLDMARPAPSGFGRALRRRSIDLEGLLAPRASQAPLPWDLIDDGIPPGLLSRELERSEASWTECAVEDSEAY